MLAIAFDMTVAELERLHPRSVRAAYADIGRVMSKHGYHWIQGSVYIGDNADLGTLVLLINELRMLPWFTASVRDIRSFRVEQWSDMLPSIKA